MRMRDSISLSTGPFQFQRTKASWEWACGPTTCDITIELDPIAPPQVCVAVLLDKSDRVLELVRFSYGGQGHHTAVEFG
jgi:hypothetical protein